MFKTYSLTFAGWLAMLLGSFFSAVGIDTTPGDLEEAVNGVLVISGLIVVYVGRIRQGDINWYGKKIK